MNEERLVALAVILTCLRLLLSVPSASCFSAGADPRPSPTTSSSPSHSIDNAPDGRSIYLHPSARIVPTSETERGIRIVDARGVPAGGEVLISVPSTQIILAERGRDTPVGRVIAAKIDDDDDSLAKRHKDEDELTYLALWLCRGLYKLKRNGQSTPSLSRDEANTSALSKADYAYLERLPKNVANLPVFWSESDLEYLQCSRVRQEAILKKAEWIATYDRLVDNYSPYPQWAEEETTLNDFLHARALVETRTFRLRTTHFESSEEQETTPRPAGLVPVADMLNHRSRSNPSTCDWCFEEGSQSFVIRAPKEHGLKMGDEATESYGLHPNSHYLSCYGFALEENRRHDGASPDEAHIVLSLNEEPRRYVLTIGNKEAAEALLTELRLFAFPKEEDKCSHSMPHGVERAAMTILRKSVVGTLNRYGTTSYEDDRGLLRDHDALPLFSNRRNAVLVRSGEKYVLRHWLFLCDAALTFLDDIEQEKIGWTEYCDVLDTTLGRVSSIAP